MELTKYRSDFEKSVSHLKSEFNMLRSGRATPALVENVVVEAYGVKQPIKSLAAISVGDPRTLFIDPWDKNILKDLEKGIAQSGIGISPSVEGGRMRLSLPPLTEESRKELIKMLHGKLEEARISIRTLREKIKSSIIEAERKKEISEDDRFKSQEKLEELVKEYNEKIKDLAENKEKEIMTV